MKSFHTTTAFIFLSITIFCQNWQLKPGPFEGSFSNLDISQSDPNIIFALEDWDLGTFKSTDNGISWAKVSSTENDLISISTIDPNYIITKNERSSDGGISWESISTPSSVQQLQFKPNSINIIYAIFGEEIKKSIDFGITWNVLDSNSLYGSPEIILMDYTHPDYLYYATADGYLSKSTNSGVTWQRNIYSYDYKNYITACIDQNNPSIIYIAADDSIFKSTNGGSNFSIKYKNNSNSYPISIAVDASSNSTIYLLDLFNDGVYKSSNSGLSWSFNFGNYLSPEKIKVSKNGSIFLSSSHGLFRSMDHGVFWRSIGAKSIFTKGIKAVTDQIIYEWGNSSVYKTTNQGQGWTSIHGHCSSGKNSFAISYQDNNKLFVCGGDSLSISTNGGNSWINKKIASLSSLRNIYLCRPNENIIYIDDGDVSFSRSTNGGNSWSLMTIPNAYISGELVTHSLNQEYVYYKGLNLLNRSTNKGANWVNLVVPVGTADYIGELTSSTISNKLFLSGGSLFVSNDDGQNWLKIYDRWVYPNTISIYDKIILDPTNEQNLYFKDHYSEVDLYGSNNGGISWSIVGGMPSTINEIYTFLINSSNKLVAATDAGLLIGTPILTDILDFQNQSLLKYNLYQNWPNPFNPSTKIHYSIPNANVVTLIVYDILGKEVTTLVNEEKPRGNHEVEFNASQISSGVYIYRMQAGSFIESKKFIFIK